MRSTTKLFSAALFSLIYLAIGLAPAQADLPPPPSTKLRSLIDDVKNIVAGDKDKVTAEVTDKKLKEIIVPLFDFDEMSRRSLGAYWSKGTPEEQHEFVALFSDLLATTYLKRIKRNAEDSKLKEMTDDISGDKAMVRSVVESEGDDISIDYRLMLEDNQWKIYDVVIENVGLVSNYRNEFPGIIRKEGFKGLNDRLKNKQVDTTGIPTGGKQ